MMFDNFANWKFLDLWKVQKDTFSDKKECSTNSDDHTNVIYSPDNICPSCSSEGCITSGGSMIKFWKCTKCYREWMTITEVKND